jgi:hypothetical protein
MSEIFLILLFGDFAGERRYRISRAERGVLFASRRLSLPQSIGAVGDQLENTRRTRRLRTVEEPWMGIHGVNIWLSPSIRFF